MIGIDNSVLYNSPYNLWPNVLQCIDMDMETRHGEMINLYFLNVFPDFWTFQTSLQQAFFKCAHKMQPSIYAVSASNSDQIIIKQPILDDVDWGIHIDQHPVITFSPWDMKDLTSRDLPCPLPSPTLPPPPSLRAKGHCFKSHPKVSKSDNRPQCAFCHAVTC